MDNALDAGIQEKDFWEMTLAEIERAISSKIRVMKAEMKQQATLDYVLSDLIGRSVARIHSSEAKMPEIYDVYPSLFERETIEEQKQDYRDELNASRFRQFAYAFNTQFNQEVANEK